MEPGWSLDGGKDTHSAFLSKAPTAFPEKMLKYIQNQITSFSDLLLTGISLQRTRRDIINFYVHFVAIRTHCSAKGGVIMMPALALRTFSAQYRCAASVLCALMAITF